MEAYFLRYFVIILTIVAEVCAEWNSVSALVMLCMYAMVWAL